MEQQQIKSATARVAEQFVNDTHQCACGNPKHAEMDLCEVCETELAGELALRAA